MLLTCPSCETRYQVDDAAIDRAAGRRVRCANCGYLWHFAPALEDNLPPEASPERLAAARAAPVRAGPAGAIPPPRGTAGSAAVDGEVAEGDAASTLELGSAAAPALATVSSLRRGLIQLGAAVVVVVAVLAPILGRNTVVETWPESAKVYEVVGLTTAGPGRGLDVKVTPLRNEGAFVITGEITNTTSHAVGVPPVRVSLRDVTQKEVEYQIVDPPVETLSPGGTAQFKTVFEHPNIAATDVAAKFGTE
ncbi:MAG: zinc-ribbon domain-containing protein [Alphaproteobacteria bacterium]|nr:zinc-ribbon domain-containing protein [Alphaproteobacteria bacterium]